METKRFATVTMFIFYIIFLNRPGGELMPGEDEADGLKRAMNEVYLILLIIIYKTFTCTVSHTISWLICLPKIVWRTSCKLK